MYPYPSDCRGTQRRQRCCGRSKCHRKGTERSAGTCVIFVFLLKIRNFLATEALKLMVVNASFSYPLSIFTLKILWFCWAEHLFTLKTNLLNTISIKIIFQTTVFQLLKNKRLIETSQRVLPSCFSISSRSGVTKFSNNLTKKSIAFCSISSLINVSNWCVKLKRRMLSNALFSYRTI